MKRYDIVDVAGSRGTSYVAVGILDAWVATRLLTWQTGRLHEYVVRESPRARVARRLQELS